MFKRKTWVELERRVPVSISEIKSEAFKFYNLANFYKSDFFRTMEDYVGARAHLTNARILLKNLIEPEQNSHIKKLHEDSSAYKEFIENLGRVDKYIDEQEEDLAALKIESEWKTNPTSPLRLRSYKKALMIVMDNLVFYPLVRACQKYRDCKKEERDSELFIYWVFLEMYHASESLGALTREKALARGKIHTFSKFPSGRKAVAQEEDEVETEEEEIGDVEEYVTAKQEDYEGDEYG